MGNSRYYNYGGRVAKDIEAEDKFKTRVLDRARMRQLQKAEEREWAKNKIDKLLIGAEQFGDATKSAKSLFSQGDTVKQVKVNRLQRELNKRAKALDMEMAAAKGNNFGKYMMLSKERTNLGRIQAVLDKDKSLAGSKSYSYINSTKQKELRKKYNTRKKGK